MDESHSTAAAEPPVDTSLLEKLLSNRLSENEARQFATESPHYITFTLLALQQRLAGVTQTIGPNTPSSVIPPFQKPPAKPKSNKKGKKNRGGQPGHARRTRDPLPQPDRTREHQCERCPNCNGELARTGKTRSRRSEDIPGASSHQDRRNVANWWSGCTAGLHRWRRHSPCIFGRPVVLLELNTAVFKTRDVIICFAAAVTPISRLLGEAMMRRWLGSQMVATTLELSPVRVHYSCFRLERFMKCLPLSILVAGQLLLVGYGMGLGIANAVEPESPPKGVATAEPVEDSMHEFMEYFFQPTYKQLKASLANETDDKNVWKSIKSDAMILAEGGNLLLSRTPVEDGDDWTNQSVQVRNFGGQLYRAAKTKDFAAATASYRSMIENCNACHKQFADGKYILTP